ncbi:MAG: RraA family protein [Anaerolineae bacterium]
MTNTSTLSAADLERIRPIPTPALSNAIELFNVRPRNAGFMNTSVRAMFPDLPPVIGYAVTAATRADQPPPAEGSADYVSRFDYWDHILSIPAPRIAVVEDEDIPAGVGAFFGEVQSNTHKALGVVAAVTNGAVRDLAEMHDLGFAVFANAACVSHAYIHLTRFGNSVRVGGIVVRPGDILHADMHGVLIIPPEVIPQIPDAVAKIEKREREIIEYCKSPGFTVDGLKALMR